MATVIPTVTNNVGSGDGSIVQFTYALTSTNTDGAPIALPEWADVCWTFTGTWGGATAAVEGSNDGATFMALANAAGGAAATASANKCMTIIENPLSTRPNLTTAGSGAAITAIATLRRANPLRT
jgi:hypothetical protein